MKRALIVVDVQNDFCHADGHFGRHGKDVSTAAATLPALVAFVHAAQERGVPCAFIRQRAEPGGRSDSPAWLRLKTRDGKSPGAAPLEEPCAVEVLTAPLSSRTPAVHGADLGPT